MNLEFRAVKEGRTVAEWVKALKGKSGVYIIPVHPDWPIIALGEITKPEYGFTEKAADQGDARFIRISAMISFCTSSGGKGIWSSANDDQPMRGSCAPLSRPMTASLNRPLRNR